jgi:pilus assembly protein CpaB
MAVRLGIFIFFVVALIGVAIFGYSIMNQTHQAYVPPPPPTEQILTAADQMNAGSLVQPTDIGASTVLISAVPTGAITDSPDHRAQLIGSMNMVTTMPGVPILDSHMLHPGDHGFLAAVLHPGMRAITINVSNTMNANGLVWPGDRVDIILTEFTGTSDNAGRAVVSEVLLSNVRIIATGKQLQGGSGNGSIVTPDSNTMTFEVTPQDALKVSVAQAQNGGGSFTMAVHSASPKDSDPQYSAPLAPEYAEDANPALKKVPTQTAPPISQVNVITGGGPGASFNF